MREEIEKLSKEFFDKLEISIDSIEIIEEKVNVFLIKIKTTEPESLIGYNGKNIDALNHILKIICSKKSENKINIHLKINNYRESKDDRLKSFIISRIKLVEKNNK